MAPDCSGTTTGPAFVATQEFLVTYCLTFVCFILFVVPFKVHIIDISWKLLQLHTFTGIFVQTFCVWNIIIRLYQAARECGHFQAPMPKTQKNRYAQDQQLPLSVSPPKDKYLEEAKQRQMLAIEDDSSLLAPSSINEPERKKSLVPIERPEPMAENTSAGDTLVSQVTPLLGITPHKNSQLQSRNTPEDIADILSTRAFQRYVDTPLQTLDGIIMNQPKHFYHSLRKPRELPKKLELRKAMSSGLGYRENNF